MRLIFIAAISILTVTCAKQARADIPIPIHTPSPVALDKLRVGNPSILPLTGTWRFQLTHGAMGRDGYHSSSSGPVTASSSQDGHSPLDAFTGAPDARWCASDESMPQWLQVDFGGPSTLASFNITWEFSNAAYLFKLETSLDGKSWKLLADHSAVGVGNGPLSFPHTNCRYVRLTISGAERTGGTAWASIRHIEIGTWARDAIAMWIPPPPSPERPEQRDAFANIDVSDSSWASIPVPWNWEMAGFSKPTYDNPDDAVGLYRRYVDIPAAFAGKTIYWHFEGVWDSAEIFINGKRAGYHESGFTAFDMDVTPYVQAGKRNLLAVRVSKTTPSDDLDTGDYWSLGGIYRDTYMVAVNSSHIRNIKVVTHLDSAYKNATLGISVGVTQAAAGELKLHGELFHADGSPVVGIAMEDHADVPRSAGGMMQLRAEVPQPLLWSAEKPNLYFAVLTLSLGDKVIERVQERFGFRQVEIKNGVVLWNGAPIKCTGTCRHEEWAALGHALNENAWRTDLKLMKGCNINAVRTSHYNHAGRFLELCDELGIYVLDEVPACWCNLSDPKLKDAFVQRTKETLERDLNKPCVLAWSLANESGYGPNAAAMLEYVKANDSTRPAFVSQCGPWNNPLIDFVDTHYPSIEEVKRLASDPMRKTTPVVMTEQPHIFYVSDGLNYDYGEKDYWGQVLASNWSVVWPTDSILGSFIWEWQDQGIADKFPDSGRDSFGLRGNNHKGIVDGYRSVKPEYWNIKMVYSPVTTDARETSISNGVCTVPLRNRYSFTDLSELTCRWQALTGQKVVNSGALHIACAPRSAESANFPATSGMDTLRIEFIHPDGRSIYSARIHVQGAPVLPAAPANDANGTASANETPEKITLLASGSELIVDRKTGEIASWRIDGADLLSGSPILNLGEHRENHGDHGASNFVESKQAPILQDAEVSRGVGPDNPLVVVVRGLVRLAEQSEPMGRLKIRYEMHPNGDLGVKWELAWAGNGVNCWELGLKLPLNPAFDNMSWARDGLWTEYPADHIGALTGSAKPVDLTYRCTKRDVRWVLMADSHGAGICAIPLDAPLHTRANREGTHTTLFLSSAISPPYDFSTNLLPDKLIHLSHGGRTGGEFLLRLVGGK